MSMLILTSPAKTLDFESDLPKKLETSEVRHPDQVAYIVENLRKLSKKKLGDALQVSEKLADENYQRFQDWKIEHTLKNARPALYAYNGDVFQQLELDTYKAKEFDYSQKSLRIMSGLYGVVRPLDLIEPYRLEMKLDLSNIDSKIGKLTDYWQVSMTADLQSDIVSLGHDSVLNLASQEYTKPIIRDGLSVPMVTVQFLYKRKGEWKSIGILAKKARGQMINWLIQNQIEKLDDVCGFAEFGYEFIENKSNDETLTFVHKGV